MSGARLARELPEWLKPGKEDGASKNTRRSILYYRQIFFATPPWVDQKKVHEIYREAARQRRAGRDVDVDHIVPLNHPLVCGLHWHGNLQIIKRSENASKSNCWWPDCWWENNLLFCENLEPFQISFLK